jgi:uncharacterized protein YkwD
MTHASVESTIDSRPAGSMLGDLARFVGLILLTLALVVGVLIGLGGKSEAASSSSRQAFRNSIVHLTNVARVAHGCRPLKQNSKLQKSAQYHANDMSAKNYFQHDSANGTIWWKRIMHFGYSDPGGENIARGFGSSASVMVAWLNSPEHRRNIMDCQFRTIGVGFNGHGDYWVQDFGY